MTSAKENLNIKRLTMNNYLHGIQLGLTTIYTYLPEEIRFWIYTVYSFVYLPIQFCKFERGRFTADTT